MATINNIKDALGLAGKTVPMHKIHAALQTRRGQAQAGESRKSWRAALKRGRLR